VPTTAVACVRSDVALTLCVFMDIETDCKNDKLYGSRPDWPDNLCETATSAEFRRDKRPELPQHDASSAAGATDARHADCFFYELPEDEQVIDVPFVMGLDMLRTDSGRT